jgi:RecA/RadA recombinase
MSKEYSINELQKELKKVNPFGDVISKNDFSKITEWIDTGNYHLNAVFSGDLFGGIPNNRTICLAGESGTGKTFLMLNMCRELQTKGYYIVYYDTEGAVDVDNIQNFGIDPEGAMKALHEIIQVFQQCQQTYGMESITMRELVAPYLTHS